MKNVDSYLKLTPKKNPLICPQTTNKFKSFGLTLLLVALVLDLFASSGTNAKTQRGLVLNSTIKVVPTIAISGKVVDKSGQPLPGVTVVVKGDKRGTVTDVEGAYSLPNVEADAVLVFSYVGMLTQEIAGGWEGHH